MSVNARIKEIRKQLGLSQSEFARKIGLSQTSLSWLEREGSRVIDRNIHNICSTFNIREEWLREGNGEMYHQQTVREMLDDPSIDDLDRKILKSYIEMKPEQRRHIKAWIMRIAKAEGGGYEKIYQSIQKPLDKPN